LFNNKIGSSLAILFHAWALELEQTGDTRKADAVYVQGIDSQAQPVDWLQSQHRYAVSVVASCHPVNQGWRQSFPRHSYSFPDVVSSDSRLNDGHYV